MIRFVFASRPELQKRNSDLVSSQISVAASLYKMWHPPSLDPRLLVRKNSTKRSFQVPKRDDIRRWFILGLIQSMACIQRTERLSVCVWMAVFLTQFRRVSVLKLILFFVILGLKVPKSMQHFKKDRNAKRKKKTSSSNDNECLRVTRREKDVMQYVKPTKPKTKVELNKGPSSVNSSQTRT